MTETALLYPMTAQLIWVALLYALLTAARAPAVWGIGTNTPASARLQAIEPKISANLSNQFEWPVFFYVVCVLLMQHGAVDSVQIGLAWLFFIGRIIHSSVQILTNNVRLRGLVFTINFLAVLVMWGLLLKKAL